MNATRTTSSPRRPRPIGVVLLAVCAVAGCRSVLDRTPWSGAFGSRASEPVKSVADNEERAADGSTDEPAGDIVPVSAEMPASPDEYDVGPATLVHPHEGGTRDVTLEEVVRIALENSTIVRDDSQFLSTANPLLANPGAVPSAFDSRIQATGGPFGIGGIDAAKSRFDPYLLANSSFGTDNLVQNNRFLSGGLVPGTILEDETGTLATRLEQRTGHGTFLSLIHNLNYSANNQPNRFFPSAYSGLLRAEVRQPLLAGAGREFTSIAGPIGRSPSAVQPVDRGLVIARINEKLSDTDFETNVRNLLRGTQAAYWDLVLAYAVYEDQVAARDAARELWKRVKSRHEAGLKGVSLADEAQARERMHQWEAAADNALSDVYESEARLRRLVGMPPNRGDLLKPADELVAAPLHPDWQTSLAEALLLRQELRRQKSTIRSLSLQLQAARSLRKPRLDVVTGAHLNGFGDNLTGGGGVNSAYGSLFGFGQTGWDFGVEFSMPFRNRAANSLVQNLQLRLAKARSALDAQEQEIRHELAYSFRELGRWSETIRSRELRLEAAETRTRAVTADYEAERVDLDALLRARTSQILARVELHEARARYLKAITDLHYRKGTILGESSIRIADLAENHVAAAE